MAGIFGIASNGNCIEDLFWGTFYLQHRAQSYCGLFVYDSKKLRGDTHAGLFNKNFELDELKGFKGNYGIGSVSITREPVSGSSRFQSGILSFDGNLINNQELKEKFLKQGSVFSGYHSPEDVTDCDLISNIVLTEQTFEKGIEKLINVIKGDFAIACLTNDGIYAARGWGRKPLILGKKQDEKGESYAVSSESTSFINLGFKIIRDVKPGEVVFFDKDNLNSIKKFDLDIKYGTFEWIYGAYPTSVIDGKSVSEVRKTMGGLLAKTYPVEVDIVSCVPNSGRWHATGYNHESYASGFGVPYEEVFVRYEYSGRSFNLNDKKGQQRMADMKLIPVLSSINKKRILLVDDSIVRGTQTKNQTKRLRDAGAKEIHARIACPPLMAACVYGKSTKKDEDCIARVMSLEDIRKSRGLESLEYATVGMLEKAIGFPRNKLCLHCWEK